MLTSFNSVVVKCSLFKLHSFEDSWNENFSQFWWEHVTAQLINVLLDSEFLTSRNIVISVIVLQCLKTAHFIVGISGNA